MRYRIVLHNGVIAVDADDESDARAEALQALVESPDLLVVESDTAVDRERELYEAQRRERDWVVGHEDAR